MAITATTNQEVTVIDVTQLQTEVSKRENANSQSSVVSSDESTCASSLSSTSSTRPRRRRRRAPRRKKAKGNNSHVASNNQNATAQLSLEEQAKYVAMDCEMVGVGYKGSRSSVARVSLVGWNGETLYDELIRQERPVTDFRTFVSGITAEDLESAEVTLEECQAQVLDLLKGKILIGHALKNDLKALNISHPWQFTRDTAKYEPFQQVRFNDGVLWPRKLKDLAKQKLHRDVQTEGKPHSPLEDALTALDLYRQARRKWEKAMDYKIHKTQEIEQRRLASE